DGRVTAAATDHDGLGAAEVDHGGGHEGAGAAVDDGRKLMAVALEYLFGIVERLVFAFGNERGGYQRRPGCFEQIERDLVVGHPYADGLARRMRHAARHFARGFEDEGPWTGRGQLEKAVLPVVDTRSEEHTSELQSRENL